MSVFLSPPPAPAAIEIVNDAGGFVHEYEQAVWRYRAEKRRVEIRGSCRSACTLALAVPNVCVGAGAEVKFHAAYENETHKSRPDVTARMLRRIPKAIADTVRGHIEEKYSPAATLNAEQLIALGIAPCEVEKPARSWFFRLVQPFWKPRSVVAR